MAIQLVAAVAEADFAWTIGSLCQINRRPFDPALLLQRFPAPHSVRQLIEALRSYGFRTGEGELAKSVFPCVGFLSGDAAKPALLVRRDAGRLLYFVAGSQTPHTAPVATLKEQLLLLGDISTLLRARLPGNNEFLWESNVDMAFDVNEGELILPTVHGG